VKMGRAQQGGWRGRGSAGHDAGGAREGMREGVDKERGEGEWKRR
jgi:hypothetical protein